MTLKTFDVNIDINLTMIYMSLCEMAFHLQNCEVL